MIQKTYEEYFEEILNWNWESILNSLENNEPEVDFWGNSYKSYYVGTVMGTFPSGKYYTFWTDNQTLEDEEEDSKFLEALENILKEKNLFLEYGEGDPTDLYICKAE